MPPRRFKKKSVRKIVEKRMAKAIEKYEKTRADSNNTGVSESTNTGGIVVPEMHGYSYKTFMNGKPHSFKGTEDDKVKFAMCTFEGRALTWWNGNVQTLGLANANQIPWSNVKAMMTTEYCPATEIQRMEQELWTLTLKGDDIEAYNNRFHELALMCPELVPTEKKKIEKYVRGFPERIKGNITSSKPANLHEAINMARELVEQSVQVKGVRSFLGHAGFYRRFIQDFSKIARPMTHLLEKETPFVFSKDCINAFQTRKKKLTEAPILVIPDWNLPFELMYDASDFAIVKGAETELTSNSPQPKMSADVARGHGGDGGGDDRPPPYQIPTGCGGCSGNRGKNFSIIVIQA
ncbi:putative reverse transcriptase domain-containing protein [Tanacetum coccineum]